VSRLIESDAGAGPSQASDTQLAERARVAAQILAQVVKLIDLSRAAGLTTVTYLLEAAVLEAASHAPPGERHQDGT
jgi:hypothetical protein